MKIRNLIVWAWLTWITIAQQLAEKWEKVLLIEQRNHIGWNCYDYYDENGILVHKYWPHIFHTDFDDVWKYVNRFTTFTDYQHTVLWSIDNHLVPIPFNLDSLYWVFPQEFAKHLENVLLQYFEYNSKVTIWQLREKAKAESNEDLQFISDYIFEKVFKNYTMKQRWISAEEINPNVMNRVPILISRDNRYFPKNKYQGMPVGWYTKMFEKMLDNTNIKVLLNTNFNDIKDDIEYEKLYYTWSIDEFFDYKFWKLEYRKTLYQLEEYDLQSYQENTVINYPNDFEYTRITEYKKFYPMSPTYDVEKTVICKEIPWKWNIEAYPIENEKNMELLNKYISITPENVVFLWRLWNYKYFDMDKTIKSVLDYIKD